MSVTGVGSSVGNPGAIPVRSDSPVRWDALVREHESYREEKAGKSLVFVGDGLENAEEIMTVPYTHRWTKEYTQREYARMQDFVRGAKDEYNDPHVVIFPALTASTMTATGDARPPLDHFEQLKRSWARGTRYELTHSMNADREKDRYPAREWEYLQVWEPTTDAGRAPGGYAHMHPVVVCDGKVGAERFRSVLEKHVEKCEWASTEAHDLDGIMIDRLDELSNPAAYLFKYLGKSWDLDDAEPYQQRFNGLLHETGYRRFQTSDGAQRWMRDDDGATEPWIYAGVADPDEVATLEQYEDAREFQVDRETGVRSYLSGYGAPESVEHDAEGTPNEACEESGHKMHRGTCVRCGVDERALCSGLTGGGG